MLPSDETGHLYLPIIVWNPPNVNLGAPQADKLQMDSNPNMLFLVAISESEEAYRSYSESEASHEQYAEMTKWLEHEPKWHDGHVPEFRVLSD